MAETVAAKHMPIIGLLGGVASGKSTVAALFGEMGAGRLDADRAGHETLSLPEVEQSARNRWGESVFDEQGKLDRKRLAAIVFAPPPDGPEQRRFLEQLTHPHIEVNIRQQLEGLATELCPLAVLDAPLLLEAGWDRLCNTLAFVEVPSDVRLARAIERGWTVGEFHAREQAQLPVATKRARADFVIENAGDLDTTREQVANVWRKLTHS